MDNNTNPASQNGTENPAGIYSTQPVQSFQTSSAAPVSQTPSPDIFFGAKPQKNRKPLIIGAVSAFVLAVAAVIMIIVTTANGPAVPTASNSSVNRYMGYIMTGSQDSGVGSGASLSLASSKAFEMYYASIDEESEGSVSLDNKIAYFEEAQKILSGIIEETGRGKSTAAPTAAEGGESESDASNAASSIQDDTAERLRLLLSQNNDQLSAIIYFLKADFTNGDLMLVQYLTGTSLQSIELALANNYARLKEVNTGNARSYVSFQNSIFSNISEITEIYASAGCIADSALLENCLNTEQTKRAEELFEQIAAAELRKSDLERGFISDYFDTARNIYNLLNSEVAE